MTGMRGYMDPREKLDDLLVSTRRRSQSLSPVERAVLAATALVTIVVVGGGLLLLTGVPIGRLLPSLVASVLLIIVAKWSGLFTRWDRDRRHRLERRAAGPEDRG